MLNQLVMDREASRLYVSIQFSSSRSWEGIPPSRAAKETPPKRATPSSMGPVEMIPA